MCYENKKNNLKVKSPFHYSPHRRYVACLDSVFVIFNTETGCAGKKAKIIQLDSFPDSATKIFSGCSLPNRARNKPCPLSRTTKKWLGTTKLLTWFVQGTTEYLLLGQVGNQ